MIPTPDASWIAGYELDASDCAFAVTTKSGERYAFKNIPREIVDGFIGAQSRGTFYNKFIRGKYQ